MATIPIPSGTRATTCNRCGKANCYWVKTQRGRWLLLEVSAAANLACLDPTHDRWGQGIVHQTTCTAAASWRTRPGHYTNPRNAR